MLHKSNYCCCQTTAINKPRDGNISRDFVAGTSFKLFSGGGEGGQYIFRDNRKCVRAGTLVRVRVRGLTRSAESCMQILLLYAHVIGARLHNSCTRSYYAFV